MQIFCITIPMEFLMPLSRCIPPLFLTVALFTGTACARPGADATKRTTLQTLLADWKGKPFEGFLKATGWKATYDKGIDNRASFQTVEFTAFGPKGAEAPRNTLTYYHVTEWNGKQPGITTTGGANQPLGALYGSPSISAETLELPESQPGCKLTVRVDAQGLINSWHLHGGDCFVETLDRLKRQ